MNIAPEAAEQDRAEIRENLARNLAQVEDAIESACRAAGRPRSEIELVAVSKVHPTAAIIEASSLGLHLFGENRVQEFAGKSVELGNLRSSIQVCLIGHLQSNKAAKAVEIFDSIDSLDSTKLALRLNEAAAATGKHLPVLIEIKLSEEETKAGLDPDSRDLSELLERLPSLANLNLQGLMTIAPFGVPEDQTRACFRTLRLLRDRLAASHPQLNFPVLSMGMSGDFALAIDEGATRIRIGTSLFGKRIPHTQ